MKAMTPKDRVEYVKNLELDPTPQSVLDLHLAPTVTEDDEQAGYVDAGSLVSFVAGVSALHKSDALNTTLLAQLAANKKHDRETQTVEWYKYYRNVLENVGWVVPSFNFLKFKASGSTFTVDAVIADVLEAISTQDDRQIIDSTISAVKALDNGDGRLVLWDQNTTSLDRGNFQISACSESDGVLVMKLGTFYFHTDKTVTSVLWFSFSSSKTEFYKGGQTVNLNEDVYNNDLREMVIKKLGKRAQDFVGNLDI